MQWLPGGRTPLHGQYGMCRWTERCQSGVRVQTLDTLDKPAIIKRHLISTNRNIHPYIIQIRTPEKLSFLDLITGRHNTTFLSKAQS